MGIRDVQNLDIDILQRDLGSSITYRTVSSGYTASTGAVVDTPTDLTIVAIRQIVTDREVFHDPAFLQHGDLKYLVQKSDLSTDPTTTDVIIDSEVGTLRVFKFEVRQDNNAYIVYARK